MEDYFAGIREFVCVANAGSFTAAATILGVTGSAVGKSVTRLETRLGVQLLHRTTRRIVLTTEGEAYLLSCRQVIEALEQQQLSLASGHAQPVGTLKIDLPTTFGRRHVMPTLLELALRHDRLNIAVSLRDRAVDMVSEGVDLAVRIGRLGDYPDLVARQLGNQRLRICAAPAYLRRKGSPQSPADLIKHDCLIGWYRAGRPIWNLTFPGGKIEEWEIKPRHEIPDGDALLNACVSGCGLAQLPNWLADTAIGSGSLIPVLNRAGF
ncbi:LysR family transcriptional regulator [Robbsia sp. KACC 23696]|uniref:LysR family transcriptional regulator n=1 Tax=Robbsia sp. KACC 23696 TaxID=3149231 RepID=UPI00325A7C73